ncbi:hypothetical protein [Pseudomonas fluorescens]|jgi:hypothetical protein|uniref:hypothetical protein n=1 Tax=Pseudomonas TaxID=286 RepID=UPI002B1CF3E0|nr:hypothetical protein [Pseudomonas fluorescens]
MAFISRASKIFVSPDPGDILEIRTSQGTFTAIDIWADPTTKEVHIETLDKKIYNLSIYEINSIVHIESYAPIFLTPIQLEDGSISSYISTSGESTINIYNFHQDPGGDISYAGVVPIYRSAFISSKTRTYNAERARVWLQKRQ